MDVYREGFLNKAGKGVIQTHLHSWRPRYFVLNGPTLKYYKTKDLDPDNMLGCIHLSEIESMGLMKSEKKCFQITIKAPKSRTYYMSGRTEDEAVGWVRAIEMGKAQQDKASETENTRNTLSMYGEETPPPQGLMGPPKPKRSIKEKEKKPIRSAYFVLGPPSPISAESSSPSTSSTKSTTLPKKIHSEYELVRNVVQDSGDKDGQISSQNSSLYEEPITTHDHDPTYETPTTTPKKSTVRKTKSLNDKPNIELGVYDTINVSPKPNNVKTVVTPPPVPFRDPSLSLGNDTRNLGGEGSHFKQAPIGIYDEVIFPGKAQNPSEPERNRDESSTPEMGTEKPLYAQVKKKSSKRRNLNLVDIGEVSHEIEAETAGGKETLSQGLTTPIGQQFAVEELRDVLEKYSKEGNENGRSEAKMIDFGVNDGESAFDVMKRFLEKY